MTFRVTSYHMPTYPQVFHKDLFVTLLEKGILEYQQSLSKSNTGQNLYVLYKKQVILIWAQKSRDSISQAMDTNSSFACLFFTAYDLEVTLTLWGTN